MHDPTSDFHESVRSRAKTKTPRPRRWAAGAVLLAVLLASAGYAVYHKEALLASFEALHRGRHVVPADQTRPDPVHHHAGHTHEGLTVRLGIVEAAGARLVVSQVGHAHPGEMGTFVVEATAGDLPCGLRLGVGTETATPEKMVQVDSAAPGAKSHLHLPVPADGVLWLSWTDAMGAQQRVALPVER